MQAHSQTPAGPLQPPELSPRRSSRLLLHSWPCGLNSQYLLSFMCFQGRRGEHTEGQACLPNLIHSHLTREREKGTTCGFPQVLLVKEASQGLGGEGDDPRSSATLLGSLADRQFPKGGDCDCSYPQAPRTCTRYSRYSVTASRTDPQA